MRCSHSHKCGRCDCDHYREHDRNEQCELPCGFYGTTRCEDEQRHQPSR